MAGAALSRGPGADAWNWDTFLKAAEKCHAAGYAFGLPMGQSPRRAVDWLGSLFRSFGASMIDEGRAASPCAATAKTQVAGLLRAALASFCPRDVWAWDDASNNRALIAGKTALILNPPSAWVVARLRQPGRSPRNWLVRADAGQGRRVGSRPTILSSSGAFGVSARTSRLGAKALCSSTYPIAPARSSGKPTATSGFDLPPFQSMSNFKVWEMEGPPAGFEFNYPDKPHHQAQLHVAFAPAPAEAGGAGLMCRRSTPR